MEKIFFVTGSRRIDCKQINVWLDISNSIYPSLFFPGISFPDNFDQIAKTIMRRLFRVYAHVYHSHFEAVVQLTAEAHLNTSLKLFIYFVREFDLIEKNELLPLQELIEKLCPL